MDDFWEAFLQEMEMCIRDSAMTAHDQELVDKLEAYMASTQADREQCLSLIHI